jgi:hypothetical protein
MVNNRSKEFIIEQMEMLISNIVCTVISAKDAVCRHTRPAALVPQPLGYLSALVAEDTGE